MVRNHRADGLFIPNADATGPANASLCEHVLPELLFRFVEC
jgi:hypothetical protein